MDPNPQTSSLSTDGIPFPSVEEGANGPGASSSPSPEPAMNNSASSSAGPNSHDTTSSSKLTSSDKLSALPPLSPNPTPSRILRPTIVPSATLKRGYRRSLDATTSLPSFSAADYDLFPHASGLGTSGVDVGVVHLRQMSPDNTSSGKETPKQRVSFDSDHNSLSAVRSVGQAFSRIPRASDPPPPIPLPRDGDSANNHVQSRTQSASRSRAASPLRMLQQWSAGFHRSPHLTGGEDPFIPINPFKLRSHLSFCCGPTHLEDIELGPGSTSSGAYDCDDLIPITSLHSFLRNSRLFFTDIFPRQMYLNFLLRLPAMYFSRVARVFEDAEVSRPDIQRMIDASGRGTRSTPPHVPGWNRAPPPQTLSPDAIPLSQSTSMIYMPLPYPDEWATPLVSPSLIRFKHSWEAFVDSLLREWKTLNLVSALLASAILTIFQIEDAASDPITRTAALISLICALMSLSYGCMYIVRFGTMRSMFHASRWAEEARRTNTSIWWNVWVFLATPAVWMAWAMISFITSILSFVWRTGSVLDPPTRAPLGEYAALGPRVAITAIFGLGLVYLCLIVKTLKKYGAHGDASARAILRGGIGGRHGGRGRATPMTDIDVGNKAGSAVDDDTRDERRGRERERSAFQSCAQRREELDKSDRNRMDFRAEGGNGIAGLGMGSRNDSFGPDELNADVELKLEDSIHSLPGLPTRS